jgi:segregation and condensation protein B
LLEQGAIEFEGGAIAVEELTALVNDAPEGAGSAEASVQESAALPVAEASVEVIAETPAQSTEAAAGGEPALETESQAVSATEVPSEDEYKTPVEPPVAPANEHS